MDLFGQNQSQPKLPTKFAIGLGFMALSFVVMIFAVQLAMEIAAPIGMQWLIITYLIQTWGELALSPVGLSAFSKYAPKNTSGKCLVCGSWLQL